MLNQTPKAAQFTGPSKVKEVECVRDTWRAYPDRSPGFSGTIMGAFAPLGDLIGEKRVDPRVKRTRELIVRAFNELVAEKGHTGLTVQEIAEQATINRATFYAYFTDQYELFD